MQMGNVGMQVVARVVWPGAEDFSMLMHQWDNRACQWDGLDQVARSPFCGLRVLGCKVEVVQVSGWERREMGSGLCAVHRQGVLRQWWFPVG